MIYNYVSWINRFREKINVGGSLGFSLLTYAHPYFSFFLPSVGCKPGKE